MKFSYAAYLISLYLYLSSVTASPVGPGSTTLNPVAGPEAGALSDTASKNKLPSNKEPVVSGTEKQPLSAVTPARSVARPHENKKTPHRKTHHVQKARPEQGNLCQTGESYCCNEEDGKNVCNKSGVSCDQTVVCCNNYDGNQFCMGDINFNMPITFNFDLNFDY
ncbi:hypothetical protein MGYG_07373 [Nannizzia gypsea CBS 118893]|uniref:Hydrophobin n=1 Tax=Arthroderma gypseum (strain ATCC MYA-4604 / CBS 118893) TaxID=535722 RepID=E4V2Z1_ARTGP|nr:hypothetical protein MGYG_07373 [Nannizzia gypsea CBS 118893]EFR04365.1 hypothetical protein MGYG_07373 [Nannizzia gypsea CBS 118893]